MTAKKVVADDIIGRVATKQWEIMRRVKEGSLSAPAVIASLQKIVENQIDRFDIETINWDISSQVHEVVVREADDFVQAVKDSGYSFHTDSDLPFVLRGSAKRGKKVRLRLASLPTENVGNERFPLVLRTYAELSGYDLASSWDLLAFVSQSPAMRIVGPRKGVIALGNSGYRKFPDCGNSYVSFVRVRPDLERNHWYFTETGMEENPHLLDCRYKVLDYILLREK